MHMSPKNKHSTTEYPPFSERLKYVMELREYNTQKLADRLYLTYSTVSGYRTGARCPDLEVLRQLSIILDVSADYLLGLNDHIKK